MYLKVKCYYKLHYITLNCLLIIKIKNNNSKIKLYQ